MNQSSTTPRSSSACEEDAPSLSPYKIQPFQEAHDVHSGLLLIDYPLVSTAVQHSQYEEDAVPHTTLGGASTQLYSQSKTKNRYVFSRRGGTTKHNAESN